MTDSAGPATTRTAKFKLDALDASCHVSTHTRIVQKSMSVRRLNTNPSRHDDLLRSGSTHQLLNRPFSSSQTGAAPPMASLLGTIPQGGGEEASGAAPGGGAAGSSLADTAETAEDTLSDAGSEFSGGSFCDAEGDSQPNQDYLDKDLGASLHDDDLQYTPSDEKGAADKS